MLRSLYSGASGMRSHQTRLDVIGNNIANVNTTGFKSGRAEFKDALSQTLQGGTSTTDHKHDTNPVQVGTGVNLATIFNDFRQGALRMTDRILDVAIEGNGFFVVQDSSGNIYYTRDGNFFLTYDDNSKTSYLVTSAGHQVLDTQGTPITLINAPVKSISIGKDGSISYVDNSGTSRSTTNPIGLAVFGNPESLKKAGGNLYVEGANTQRLNSTSNYTQPGQGTAGTLASGYLEMSNVDLTKEFTDMIITQRGFQANARTITVSDTILEELINLKR